MAGRKVFDEQDARRCLLAAKSWRGGLREWARANGVDGRSLNAWRVNLEGRGGTRKRRRSPAQRVRLVELIEAPPKISTGFLLRVSGVEFEVGEAFEEQALGRLIRLLKSC